MGDLQLSNSSPSVASTVLPTAEVVVLPKTKQDLLQREPAAFTKTSVGKLQCPAGRQEVFFWDSGCRGFGLRTLASGRRTWIFQYRDEHGRTRRIALGDVTAVPLDAARQAARQHAASVTRGENPSAERKAKRKAISLRDIVEAYLRQAKTNQRGRSFEETERHLLKHAAPLHHCRAEAIHRSDVSSLLQRVSEASGPIAANRLRAALSALWSWSMRSGLIEADVNPVMFTHRHLEKARERTLTDDELNAIWVATEGPGDYARIVRLCVLTGCRREEIGGLRWEEILPEHLLISGKRMKAGIAHEVALLPAINAALPPRPDAADCSVFGRNATGFSGWSKGKARLDAKLNRSGSDMPRWTLHDLRRTFSTRLHDAGIEPIVVEALLAHKQQGVAAVYNRASFREAKRAALERWHSILADIVGRVEPRKGHGS